MVNDDKNSDGGTDIKLSLYLTKKEQLITKQNLSALFWTLNTDEIDDSVPCSNFVFATSGVAHPVSGNAEFGCVAGN